MGSLVEHEFLPVDVTGRNPDCAWPGCLLPEKNRIHRSEPPADQESDESDLARP